MGRDARRRERCAHRFRSALLVTLPVNLCTPSDAAIGCPHPSAPHSFRYTRGTASVFACFSLCRSISVCISGTNSDVRIAKPQSTAVRVHACRASARVRPFLAACWGRPRTRALKTFHLYTRAESCEHMGGH